MATNYNSLIESEKVLKTMVLEFLEYSYRTHQKLWTYIFAKEDGHKIIDSIDFRIKEAEQKERDLVDECIWIISKDGPRANHLRFIISIIYSTKDIAKSVNYSASIIKTFVRKKIVTEQINMIKKLIDNYLMLFDKFIKMYKSEKILDKFDESEKMYLEFIEFSHDITKQLKLNLAQQEHELDYFPISQIIKWIESTVERIKSIFANAVLKEKARI